MKKTYLYYQECEHSDGLTEQIVNSMNFYREIANGYYLSACEVAGIEPETLWTNYRVPTIMKAVENFTLPGEGCGMSADIGFFVNEGEIVYILSIEDIDKLNEIYKAAHGVSFLDHHTIWEYTDELADEIEDCLEYLELY